MVLTFLLDIFVKKSVELYCLNAKYNHKYHE